MKWHLAYRIVATRRSASLSTSLLALTCAGLAGGCAKSGSEPEGAGERIEITSQSAALTAIGNTEAALRGIVDSGGFLADSTSLAETLTALGGSSESCETSWTTCDPSDVGCVPQTTTECTTEETTKEDLEEVREDLRTAADDLVEYLRQEVFIEANLVSEGTTDTQVTYRLGPEVLCSHNSEPDAPPSDVGGAPPSDPAPELDPECVANAEKANLRVRLTQPRPSDVDVTFIATSEDHEPLTLQLYADRLGAKVNLAEALKTLETMGEDVDNVDSLEGLVQLQLVKNAALDYSVQLSILEALSLSLHDDNDDNLAYSVEATSPTVELRVDGNTKALTARYNYGAIQLLAPLRMLASMFGDGESTETPTPSAGGADPLLVAPDPAPEPEKAYTGVVELLVAGYTGTFTYTAESDEFRFSDVSLGQGTSTLKHDGNLLASVDLNPNDGRGFDMVVRASTDAEGDSSALISIDPTIDLNIALQFENIADQVDDIPEGLLDDELRVWFEGSSPEIALGGEHLRMMSGSMHMRSKQNPDSNIDVDEGMCLREQEDSPLVEGMPVEEPADNFFGMEVVSCP